FLVVANRRHSLRSHPNEIEWCANLLIVVPPGDVQHRCSNPLELVLVALRFPEIIQPGMFELLAPPRHSTTNGLVHGQQRQMSDDCVPSDSIHVLQYVAGSEVVPTHVEREWVAGWELDKRIRRAHQRNHCGEVW